MELVFMNRNHGEDAKTMKIFEEPVDFGQICSQLNPEHKGEEVLENWFFAGAGTSGEVSLIHACFNDCMDACVLELEEELNQTCAVFEKWEDEALLSTLAQAAEQCGISFYLFVWERWKCVLDEAAAPALREEFEILDPSWKWLGIAGEILFSELRDFVQMHPKQVMEVSGKIVILNH